MASPLGQEHHDDPQREKIAQNGWRWSA